jgi:hypothetical protein
MAGTPPLTRQLDRRLFLSWSAEAQLITSRELTILQTIHTGANVREPSRRVRESASAQGRASQSNAVIALGPSGQVEAQHPHGRRGAAAAHGLILPAVGVARCDHDREKPDNVPHMGLWISDSST